MTVLLLDKNRQRDFDSAYERDFDDLVCGRRAGHMGHHEYENGSMALWTDFIDTHGDQYYIPQAEIELIEGAAEQSAALLGDQPITLVSRGCGTKFLAKEGRLIRHLKNVVGVVYIDKSAAALEQSMAEGRSLLPHAWHKPIQDDLYDPRLRYPVQGTEVGVMFGVTPLNIEGFPTALPPKRAYSLHLAAINLQMLRGAHMIMTLDHNHDAPSVERAYAGQGEFAKEMLRKTGSLDPDSVDFVVKFYKRSQTLAHGFLFRRDEDVVSRSGIKRFKEGEILWFNNSVKPAVGEAIKWNTASGYSYARSDIQMDILSRLGWHHLCKQ